MLFVSYNINKLKIYFINIVYIIILIEYATNNT